jgi:cytochrome b561
MSMAASRTRYTTVAIVMHWLIAAAIIFQIILGWRMGDEPKGPATYALFQLHKSIGITILLLSLARLAWRLVHPPPPHPGRPAALGDGSPRKIVHVAFYVIMIGLPVTGWIMVSTSRLAIPTVLYGVIPGRTCRSCPNWRPVPSTLWHEIGETATACWSRPPTCCWPCTWARWPSTRSSTATKCWATWRRAPSRAGWSRAPGWPPPA